MINLTELAKDIHENAVKHGWWESERPTEEIFALIHSEWSEALEEARNGRPMIYYLTTPFPCSCGFFDPDSDKCVGDKEHHCPMNYKPEGIAVELIDGCIRILDYLVHIGALDRHAINNSINNLEICHSLENDSISHIVCLLHNNLSYFRKEEDSSVYQDARINNLHHAIAIAFVWLKVNGVDPMQIMQIKHEYNKTRPYKHGKKF